MDKQISDFSGAVFSKGDPGYDEARSIWNGAIDIHPTLIARCTGTADVVTAVRWARNQGMEASVRAGGHGVAGNALCNGLVIDLSAMKGIRVDPKSRRVWVQPGVLLGELDRETQVHGLVVPAGIVSHTGVAGLTLGGGIGNLMRAHGLTCDNLLGVEIVTAEGRVVHVTDDELPELMWGLRGGGGNFGIVTSFEFRAVPLGPTVLAGALLFAAEEAHEVLAGYRQFTVDAPREIATIVNLRWTPPAPWVPSELHGRPIVMVSCMYAGPVEDGERALKPLRDIGHPLADLVAPMPFVQHQRMYDGAVPHGLGYFWKSPYLHDLDAHAIRTLADRAWDAKSHKSYTIIPHMGGAIRDVEAGATAFEDRTATFAPNINAAWDDASEPHPDIEWVRDLFSALEPSTTGRAYVNFQSEMRAVDAYGGAKYERLARLKTQWDPDNFFRSNHNVAPAR